MFVTALGLIWVLGRQAGNDAVVLGWPLCCSSRLACGGWVRGSVPDGRFAWWPLIAALAAVA